MCDEMIFWRWRMLSQKCLEQGAKQLWDPPKLNFGRLNPTILNHSKSINYYTITQQ